MRARARGNWKPQDELFVGPEFCYIQSLISEVCFSPIESTKEEKPIQRELEVVLFRTNKTDLRVVWIRKVFQIE